MPALGAERPEPAVGVSAVGWQLGRRGAGWAWAVPALPAAPGDPRQEGAGMPTRDAEPGRQAGTAPRVPPAAGSVPLTVGSDGEPKSAALRGPYNIVLCSCNLDREENKMGRLKWKLLLLIMLMKPVYQAAQRKWNI